MPIWGIALGLWKIGRGGVGSAEQGLWMSDNYIEPQVQAGCHSGTQPLPQPAHGAHCHTQLLLLCMSISSLLAGE